MEKIWKIKEHKNNNTDSIVKKFGVNELVAQILLDKNLSEDEIEVFLNPKRNNFHNPFDMPDMKEAVDRIIVALNNKEKIVIYGDYDADGVTSTTILYRFFKDIEADVSTYIPNRLTEGYGMNEDAIRKIAEDGCNLIITVDTGITAVNEVELAKELGMDVIVTDHHEPADEIPKAIAVVDLKRKDSKYPFRELAGCGVAFKLCMALCEAMKLSENEALKLLDFACIGTISDVVPLEDENRVIVKLGLMLLERPRHVGVLELIKIAGIKEMNSSSVAYGITPRINACGRMGCQEYSLELFTTNDPIVARELAVKVDKYNKERQEIEKRIFIEAQELAEKESDNDCIVIGGDNWHHGVIGIAASKITDKYFKPSILLCFEDDLAKGSGRSIPGFDLHEALMHCNSYLDKCGGHSMAVGLSLKKENFEKFKNEMIEYAKANITEEMLVDCIEIENELKSSDIKTEFIKELNVLEPFGEANKEPVFMYKNIKIKSVRTMSEGKHVKFTLQDGNVMFDAVGFGKGELADEYQIDENVDVVGTVQINSFNNKESVQMLLVDIRKTTM